MYRINAGCTSACMCALMPTSSFPTIYIKCDAEESFNCQITNCKSKALKERGRKAFFFSARAAGAFAQLE